MNDESEQSNKPQYYSVNAIMSLLNQKYPQFASAHVYFRTNRLTNFGYVAPIEKILIIGQQSTLIQSITGYINIPKKYQGHYAQEFTDQNQFKTVFKLIITNDKKTFTSSKTDQNDQQQEYSYYNTDILRASAKECKKLQMEDYNIDSILDKVVFEPHEESLKLL